MCACCGINVGVVVTHQSTRAITLDPFGVAVNGGCGTIGAGAIGLTTACGAVCVALAGACSGAIFTPGGAAAALDSAFDSVVICFCRACCAGSWWVARTGDDGIKGDAAEIVSWSTSPSRTP
jgi:hypothetical protein